MVFMCCVCNPPFENPGYGLERACNSHRAYTDGIMLAVTKNNVSVFLKVSISPPVQALWELHVG